MKNKLFANWGLKLISLFIAFGLWYVVVYATDPIGETVFTDIPVVFLNENLIQDQNMVSEVLDGTNMIRRVTVKGKRQTLDAMKDIGATVIATADYADMREDFTIPIELSVPDQYRGSVNEITLTDGSPVVKLRVEELLSRNIRVEGRTTGEIREGYQITEVRTDVNMITVSGATSKVNAISKAAVVQDVTNVDSDITASGSILLFDQDGNQMDMTGLQRSLFTTDITVRISATKEVPIEYRVFGTPAEGYQATGVVETTLNSIKVAGSTTVLNNLNSIVIGGEGSLLDITGATETLDLDINVRNAVSAAGVQVARDVTETVGKVTVYIEKEVEKSYQIPESQINIINLPEGSVLQTPGETEVPRTYTLVLTGLRETVDRVNAETLLGTVDVAAWMQEQRMEELLPGTYSIPIQFTLPEGVEQPDEVEAIVIIQAEEDLLGEEEGEGLDGGADDGAAAGG